MMAGKITIGKKRALGLHRIVLPPSRSACSVSFSQAARKVRLQSDPQCELSTNSGAKADWPLAASSVFTGNGKKWGESCHYTHGHQVSDFIHQALAITL